MFNGEFGDQVAQFQQVAEQISVPATSPDHSVEVVAGPGGSVRELNMNHRAYQMSAAELGDQLVNLIDEATNAADAQLRQKTQEFMNSNRNNLH
ncbi:YbaB/EbfC family nucleoid-associated protein [Haloglycomyces albus]|uniref:YbaB/EbfC family nucleoid-associated protein n=1 Tax=Haloglycomyces albus TaxID=526067 RepID=UPI00046CACCD|nr:YbaB/EbfC family nucleoid-associated protein [Haloglycomyces albus]